MNSDSKNINNSYSKAQTASDRKTVEEHSSESSSNNEINKILIRSTVIIKAIEAYQKDLISLIYIAVTKYNDWYVNERQYWKEIVTELIKK